MKPRLSSENSKGKSEHSDDEHTPQDVNGEIQRRLKDLVKRSGHAVDVRKPKPGKGI